MRDFSTFISFKLYLNADHLECLPGVVDGLVGTLLTGAADKFFLHHEEMLSGAILVQDPESIFHG
jgi:hypothetical protein